LQATITPANADDQNVTWRFTPSSRITKLKANGLTATLTSSKAGTYTVTATLGNFQASCEVNFVDELTGVEDIYSGAEKYNKRIQDGQLIIINNGQKINALGQPIE
jgi:uncharacterized protein YjdB